MIGSTPTLVNLMRINTVKSLAKAEYLVIEGFNVNERDARHWTPLHYAVLHGRKAMVKSLVRYGAYVNARNADFLDTPLHIAAGKGLYSIVRELISCGADVNAVNKDGNTPLAHALTRASKDGKSPAPS